MEFSLVLKRKVYPHLVCGVSFHPIDSNLFVSVSRDKKIILSSVKDGKVVWENDELNAVIFCVDFNRNGKWVAGGGRNGQLMVMDAKNGKSCFMVNVSYWINCLAFRSNNKIVCGLRNGTIMLVDWQQPSKSVEKTIQVGHAPIWSIAISPLLNDLVMVGDYYGSIKSINLRKENVIREYEKHSGYVRSLQFNEDGSKFISGSMDREARLYSMDQINPMMKFEGLSGRVQFAGLLHDNERLITCSYDDTIKYWNVHSGKCLLTTSASGNVWCGDVSKDEKYTAFGCYCGSIEIYSCPARPAYSMDNKVVLTFY